PPVVRLPRRGRRAAVALVGAHSLRRPVGGARHLLRAPVEHVLERAPAHVVEPPVARDPEAVVRVLQDPERDVVEEALGRARGREAAVLPARDAGVRAYPDRPALVLVEREDLVRREPVALLVAAERAVLPDAEPEPVRGDPHRAVPRLEE